MAITDSGVPTTDPHSMLKTLITDHLVSPDGVWTPVVNTGWLEFKRQKTYQISIMASYGESEDSHFSGATTMPKTVSQFFVVTLYAPTRAKHWDLFQKFTDLMNTRALTCPDLTGQGVDGSDYHFVKMFRSDSVKAIELESPKKGMGGDAEGDCIGYQSHHNILIRWNE